MTQEEKANEVLDQLFRSQRNRRVGLSEKFLRAYAHKKWVGPGVQLSADALICEANKRVWLGEYIRFRRGTSWFFAPRKKKRTARGNFGEEP